MNKETAPKIKPEEKATTPVKEIRVNVDDEIDRQRDEEMLGLDYRQGDDPEDLSTYLEAYQND